MAKQAPDIPSFVKGKGLLASQLNELAALIPTLLTGGNGISIIKSGGRFIIGLDPTAPVNVGVHKAFRVKSVEVDYLICRTWNGKTEGSIDVKIALPPLLRRSPFDLTVAGRDGFTYVYLSNTERTSTKTADATTEEQEIIPRYVVNDIIIAVKSVAGSTGVFQDTENGAGINPIEWIDANFDDRMWREKAE